VVGPLGAQPVGRCEQALDAAHVQRAGAQRRELVGDDLGLGLAHRTGDGLSVERIGDDRPRAERLDDPALGRRAGHAHDVVASRDELRDELGADRSGGARHEHPHEASSKGRDQHAPEDRGGSPCSHRRYRRVRDRT
jgi:hypothetical protein